MVKRADIPIARDIMKPHPFSISGEFELADAIRLLIEKGFSAAPVVDPSGRLIGVLSEYDCLSVLAQAAAEKWPLGKVSDRMTIEVESVSPGEDVFALSTRFCQGRRHRRLFVVEDGKLIGVISRRDLVGALDNLTRGVGGRRRESTYEAIEKRHLALD